MSADGPSGAFCKGNSIKPFETGTETDDKFPHTDTNTCSESHTESGEIRTHRREQNEHNKNVDDKQDNENAVFNNNDVVDTCESLKQAKDNLLTPTETQNVSISSKDSEVCKTGIDELLELFPFICGICDERYNKISRYLEHVASHIECKEEFFHFCLERDRSQRQVLAPNHQLEIFLCGVCNKVFETICHLHEHLIKTEATKKYIYDESTHTAYKYSTATNEDEASYSEINSPKDTENKNTSRESKSCRTKRNTDDDVIHKAFEDISVPETKNVYDKVVKSNEADTNCPSQNDADNYKVVKLEMLDGVETSTSSGNDEEAMMAKEKSNIKLDTATKKDELQVFKQTKKNPGTSKRKSESGERKIGRENMVKSRVKQEESLSSSDTELNVARDDVLDNTDDKASMSKLLVTVKSLKTKKNRESKRVRNSKLNSETNKDEIRDVKQNNKNPSRLKRKCESHKHTNRRRKLVKTKVEREESSSSSDSTNAELDVSDAAIHKLDNTLDSASKPKLPDAVKPKRNKESERVLIPCQICGKMYTTNHLKKHEKTHTESRNYECDICHKRFTTRPNLHTHKISHTEGLNYTCDFCGKAFKTLDVRAHVCETCGKAFKRIGLLTRHKKSHSEVRPFSCKVCGKTFKFPGDCKRHEMIHEPPRHFCPVCNKGFVTSCNRKIHMKVHST